VTSPTRRRPLDISAQRVRVARLPASIPPHFYRTTAAIKAPRQRVRRCHDAADSVASKSFRLRRQSRYAACRLRARAARLTVRTRVNSFVHRRILYRNRRHPHFRSDLVTPNQVHRATIAGCRRIRRTDFRRIDAPQTTSAREGRIGCLLLTLDDTPHRDRSRPALVRPAVSADANAKTMEVCRLTKITVSGRAAWLGSRSRDSVCRQRVEGRQTLGPRWGGTARQSPVPMRTARSLHL